MRQHQRAVTRFGRVAQRDPPLAPIQHRRPAAFRDELVEQALHLVLKQRFEPLALESYPIFVKAWQQLTAIDRQRVESILE